MPEMRDQLYAAARQAVEDGDDNAAAVNTLLLLGDAANYATPGGQVGAMLDKLAERWPEAGIAVYALDPSDAKVVEIYGIAGRVIAAQAAAKSLRVALASTLLDLIQSDAAEPPEPALSIFD